MLRAERYPAQLHCVLPAACVPKDWKLLTNHPPAGPSLCLRPAASCYTRGSRRSLLVFAMPDSGPSLALVSLLVAVTIEKQGASASVAHAILEV